jgi:hypothetical protein
VASYIWHKPSNQKIKLDTLLSSQKTPAFHRLPLGRLRGVSRPTAAGATFLT